MAVWLADMKCITVLLESGADINEVDKHGMTPLMIAVELLPRSPEYTAIIKCLLERRADPRQRSGVGWSALDTAISRLDRQLIHLLLEVSQLSLRSRWEARLALLARSLLMLPDFECRIRWEFESPIFPGLNKIAPYDVLWFRKRGACLRIDTTLASWKRFRFIKRRDLSTLFCGDDPLRREKPSLKFCMLNHSKRHVVDVTEGLHQDERNALIDDVLSADVLQWDLELNKLDFHVATNWLGQASAPSMINGWNATKFDASGSLDVLVRKKGCYQNSATFEDYFGYPLPPDVCLPEIRHEFMNDTLLLGEPRSSEHSDRQKECTTGATSDTDEGLATPQVFSEWPSCWPGDNFDLSDSDVEESPEWQDEFFKSTRRNNPAPNESDKINKTRHRVLASVWLTEGFALSMQEFLPVLDAVSLQHEAIRRLREFLSSELIKQSFERAKPHLKSHSTPAKKNVFPVKISVPLNFAVRANVLFESFELRHPGEISPEVFNVPRDYVWLPRREAQKTLSRAKKRLLLAQVAM